MTKKKDPPKSAGDVQGQITQSGNSIAPGERKSKMSETFKFTGVCDTDAKAMVICKQIKEIRENRDYMVAWYKDAIRKVEEAADFETMGLESALSAYFQTVPHKKTKTQESYSFPGGKLLMKRQEPEYKKDEKTAVEWLKANGGGAYIRTKEELAWKELKDAASGVVDGKIVLREEINEDGEIVQVTVPGIEVIEREAKFVVEV